MVWPFPSSKNSHFQNEASAKPFLWKWLSFICMILKNHSHINGFALSLSLKQRLGQEKWPPVGVWPDRISLTFPWLLFSDSNESVRVIQYNFGMNKGLLIELRVMYIVWRNLQTPTVLARVAGVRGRMGRNLAARPRTKSPRLSQRPFFGGQSGNVHSRHLARRRSLRERSSSP